MGPYHQKTFCWSKAFTKFRREESRKIVFLLDEDIAAQVVECCFICLKPYFWLIQKSLPAHKPQMPMPKVTWPWFMPSQYLQNHMLLSHITCPSGAAHYCPWHKNHWYLPSFKIKYLLCYLERKERIG